jgi:hypothetical protein
MWECSHVMFTDHTGCCARYALCLEYSDEGGSDICQFWAQNRFVHSFNKHHDLEDVKFPPFLGTNEDNSTVRKQCITIASLVAVLCALESGKNILRTRSYLTVYCIYRGATQRERQVQEWAKTQYNVLILRCNNSFTWSIIAPMTETANTSETSVSFYETTRGNIPGDGHVQVVTFFPEHLL